MQMNLILSALFLLGALPALAEVSPAKEDRYTSVQRKFTEGYMMEGTFDDGQTFRYEHECKLNKAMSRKQPKGKRKYYFSLFEADEEPKCIVNKLLFTLNGRSVPIPASLVSRLSDVSAGLTTGPARVSAREVDVMIPGSDGRTSYTVVLHIKDYRVRRATITAHSIKLQNQKTWVETWK
jgi:hypothetical protein